MDTKAYAPFRSAACQAEYLTLYDERAKAWPVPSETVLLDTPAGQTYVRISGPADGPPLVLLHGARGHSLMWVPNIAALSARHRVYAVDTIGEMGRSYWRRPVTRLPELVTWLDEVLTQLSPSAPASLAGLSFGGMLATLYALEHPTRVHKLILLAPAATVLPVSAAFLLRALPTVLPAIRFRYQFYYWLLADAVASGPAGRAFVDDAIEMWDKAEHCFAAMLTVSGRVLSDREWAALKVPTLYVVGEHEKVYPAQQALARMARVAPQVQARLIPAAGHDLWLSQSAVVNRALLDFLDEPAR